MEIKKIQYNIENFKSRIPGLFTYIEDGEIYNGACGVQGCYDKYVCDLQIPDDVPLIIEDNFGNIKFINVDVNDNFNHTISLPLFNSNKNCLKCVDNNNNYIFYSYRTLITIYHKYKIIRDIVKQQYYLSYKKANSESDIIKKIEMIEKFLDYIDEGIGYYTIEQLLDEYKEDMGYSINGFTDEEYLVPIGIYLSTAYSILEQMRILKRSCEIYDELLEADKSEYSEFCCNCQKYYLMGGDGMVELLEYCSNKAEKIAEVYNTYTNKKSSFDVATTLFSTSTELGVFQQFRNIWEPGKKYEIYEIVYYNGDSYRCNKENNGLFDENEQLIKFPDNQFKKIKEIDGVISNNTIYSDLNNVKGGNKITYNTYTITGKTNSRLKSLRRYKSFIESNIEVQPDENSDWLFYYRKGVINNRKLTDNLGNILKIEPNEKKKKECNYYIYGDVITDIKTIKSEESEECKLIFEYFMNAHIKITDIELSTNDDGEIIEIYSGFEIDEESNNGKHHGIKYKEEYIITKEENELYNLINNGDYFLMLSGTKVKNDLIIDDFIDGEKVKKSKESKGFIECYYTFDEYVNGEGVTYNLIKEDGSGIYYQFNEVKIYCDKDGYVLNSKNNLESQDINKGTSTTEWYYYDFGNENKVYCNNEGITLNVNPNDERYKLNSKVITDTDQGNYYEIDGIQIYCDSNGYVVGGERYNTDKISNAVIDITYYYYKIRNKIIYCDKYGYILSQTPKGEKYSLNDIITLTIPDVKKYEFSIINNKDNIKLKTLNGFTYKSDVIVDFEASVDNKVDYEYNNLYKEDYLLGIHYQPYVKENIKIDRGNGDAFERFYKLTEIKTMNDLENYQNGGFFKIEKMN